MEISVLCKHGSSIRAIARSTGWSRNTVRRYLRGGEAAATRQRSAKRVEKLDPFKDYIRERIAAAVPDALPAVVLFRELRARGYTGGETRVKDFVRGLRPVAPADPVVRNHAANARVHDTTGEVPAARLLVERRELQQLPPPYGSGAPRQVRTRRASPPAIAYQHPLSVYEGLYAGGAA